MGHRASWGKTVLCFSLVEASKNTDRICEYDALRINHLEGIVSIVGSHSKSPQRTLRVILNRLCDAGIIQEVHYDVYRFVIDVNEVIRLLESYDQRRMSSGERMVANLLDSMGIPYTREKTFKDLRMLGLLRFDFYFESLNSKFAIEYNGRQHYMAIPFFGGIPGMIRTNLSDKLKREYVRKNDINLLTLRDQDRDDARNKIEEFVHVGLEKNNDDVTTFDDIRMLTPIRYPKLVIVRETSPVLTTSLTPFYDVVTFMSMIPEPIQLGILSDEVYSRHVEWFSRAIYVGGTLRLQHNLNENETKVVCDRLNIFAKMFSFIPQRRDLWIDIRQSTLLEIVKYDDFVMMTVLYKYQKDSEIFYAIAQFPCMHIRERYIGWKHMQCKCNFFVKELTENRYNKIKNSQKFCTPHRPDGILVMDMY